VTLAYREEGPGNGPVVLLIHGYPESSYMWRRLMPAIAGAGWRAVAPDLAGFGDSPPDPPGTWERHLEALGRFHSELGLGPVVLVVHDWGGLIGLAWACEHPDAVRGLVVSDTGFFADARWHDMAQVMRSEGEGEKLLEGLDRESFGAMLRSITPAFDDETLHEYWRAFDGQERRRTHLDFYRSMDFEKLARYDGQLAALDVPALLLWGANDHFAPVSGAKRFERELPHTELVVAEGASHFVFEDAPDLAADAVTRFLARLR
jgi:haloalkane dehalogenase